MKTLFKILSVMANIAIITGLVRDTYHKVASKKASTTNIENDEV